ncbi:MAG: nucleotidyltransferase domain-containing protein [Anaerolineales bacterium]|jgi:predicted nucleotidyltransferase
MQIDEIKKVKQQLYKIAAKYGILKVYVFGSVARGESNDVSDVDFLIEMDDNVSAFNVGAFQYEVQQLLGVKIDVIPTFALKRVDDQDFVKTVQSEAVAL